jgi:O-antigen/teichoic acid export membrane protein
MFNSAYQRLRDLYHRAFEHDFLRRIVRNSSYLVSATVFSAAMGMLQNVFMFRILLTAGTGLVGAIAGFTNLVNRITSFRIHELVIRYVRRYEEEGARDKAAAVFKLAGLFEVAGQLAAFVIIFIFAPLGVRLFSDSPGTENLFILYGSLVLINMVFESSDGLLQVFDRFSDKAIIDSLQSVIRVALTALVFFTGGGMLEFILAELAGRLVRALLMMGMALRTAKQNWGAGWWHTPISVLQEDRRQLFKFAFSTNLSATISLAAKDSESLWVNAFLGNVVGGYYTVALNLIGLLQIPISPLPATTYPELSLAVAKNDWRSVGVILRRGTLLASLYSLPVVIVLILFGQPIIELYASSEFLPAYVPLVILALGYSVANIFYWNRAALLAFNRPVFPTVVNFIGMLLKIAGILFFAAAYGAEAFAALLAGFYVFTVGIAALRVLLDVRNNQRSFSLA